jgi:hypothetical protein
MNHLRPTREANSKELQREPGAWNRGARDPAGHMLLSLLSDRAPAPPAPDRGRLCAPLVFDRIDASERAVEVLSDPRLPESDAVVHVAVWVLVTGLVGLAVGDLGRADLRPRRRVRVQRGRLRRRGLFRVGPLTHRLSRRVIDRSLLSGHEVTSSRSAGEGRGPCAHPSRVRDSSIPGS